MNEKRLNDFFIGKGKRIVYVIKAYLIQDSYFLYVVEAFITLAFRSITKQQALQAYTTASDRTNYISTTAKPDELEPRHVPIFAADNSRNCQSLQKN